MISLDDSRWGQLEHAYGRATDTPELLRSLASSTGPKTSYQDEPWFGLWSSLCHQGDIYTASYVAVPHIVRLACETAGPIDFSFFELPATIEIARKAGRGPAIPLEYAEDYHDAITQLGRSVHVHRNDPWDQATLLSAAAALAVAKGHIGVAETFLNLDDEWIAKINGCDSD